jgi:hypothetical protein
MLSAVILFHRSQKDLISHSLARLLSTKREVKIVSYELSKCISRNRQSPFFLTSEPVYHHHPPPPQTATINQQNQQNSVSTMTKLPMLIQPALCGPMAVQAAGAAASLSLADANYDGISMITKEDPEKLSRIIITFAISAVAISALVTALAAMYIEASSIAYLAFMFPLFTAPYVIHQRRKIQWIPGTLFFVASLN